MDNWTLTLPNLDMEELAYIKERTQGLSEQDLNQFILIYRNKRRDPQLILITTILGFRHRSRYSTVPCWPNRNGHSLFTYCRPLFHWNHRRFGKLQIAGHRIQQKDGGRINSNI